MVYFGKISISGVEHEWFRRGGWIWLKYIIYIYKNMIRKPIILSNKFMLIKYIEKS